MSSDISSNTQTLQKRPNIIQSQAHSNVWPLSELNDTTSMSVSVVLVSIAW